MKKLLVRLVLLLSASASAGLAAEVSACVCFPQKSPYAEHEYVRAVFSGRVVGVRDASGERLFRFAVGESFKGSKASEIEVSAGSPASDCYSGFEAGEEYLVYAYGKSDSALGTSMCSRTKSLAWAQDDVYYLRALSRGATEPRVYGSVSRLDKDPAGDGPRVVPLEGITILVEGGGRSFEAVTDKNGRFEIADVPDGSYKARPVLPDKYTAYFPASEEFVLGTQEEAADFREQHGSSAYARFRVGWNNELGGKLLDAEGNPLHRAVAQLFHFEGSQASPLLVQTSEFNHAEGKYSFRGLTPGRYLPAVKVEAPFKTGESRVTFYLGGSARAERSREIEVGESVKLSDKDVRLPQPYLVRQLEGVVVWPDGRPAARAWVMLAAEERAEGEDEMFDWGNADEQGRFSLQGFVGAEYWVLASVSTSGMKSASGEELRKGGVRELNARPLKVSLGTTNEPLRIVIPIPEGVSLPK